MLLAPLARQRGGLAWDRLRVDRNKRMFFCPSVRARRLVALAVLTTATAWWLTIGVAWADTPASNSALPTISGVAQQGNQLVADPGSRSGDDPITFTCQWSDGQTGNTDTSRRRTWGSPSASP